MDCIFCKIVAGEVPTKFLYQDDEVVSFRDIHPQSPTHLLIIPRRHIPSVAHLTREELPLIGHMIDVANQLARQGGFSEYGYQLVINTGKEGGQVVPHLHLHLLSRRKDTLEG